MIDIVNRTIDRTSRLTGMAPEEVVRRGLVRAEIPLYSKFQPSPVVPTGPGQPDQGMTQDRARALAAQLQQDKVY